MSGVYEGLTVIELADRRNQWAGKLLSDGGARVIQIEPIDGSPGRWTGPFVQDKPDADNCLDYWFNNTGKQSVALDLARKPAQDVLRKLLARADVFLESTAPGTLAKMQLDYASVAGNKGLIYASLTDFGQDGPWHDFQMNDAAHLALGGAMASTGYSDATVTPIGGKGNQAWHMGCAFVLHAITVALFDRMTSGEGQYIDVAIHDACAIGTEGAVPHWMYFGETMYRQTGMHAAPRRLPPLELPTRDGKYVMAINQAFSKRSWDALLDWMDEKGVTGELRDPKFQDESVRTAEYRQGNLIRDAIRRLIAVSDAEECFRRAQTVRHFMGDDPRRGGKLRHCRTTNSAITGATSSTRKSGARFRIRAGRLRAMRCRSSRAAVPPTWVSIRATCSRKTWGLTNRTSRR